MTVVAKPRLSNVMIEGARIIFRNFEGRAEKFNEEGNRNFNVVLEDPQMVESMLADGWNIKYLKAREEGEEPTAILQVKVKFGQRPPNIVFVTSHGKTTLDESEAWMVDLADMKNVDVLINPFEWNVNGNTGVKAYLKSIFITLNEDELELKYAHLEELGSNGLQLALEGGNPNEPEDVGEYAEVVEEEPTEAPF